MKIKENQKLIMSVFSITVFTVAMCLGLIKITGMQNFVGACVSLLIPSTSSSTYKEISIDTKNSFFDTLLGTSLAESGEDKVGINALAYTPEDIKKLMSNAEKTFNSAQKGGSIEEKTYLSDSANTIKENILVKNTTGKTLDIAEVLKKSPEISKAKEGEVSVLIFHTHTSECYQILDKDNYLKSFSSRTTDLEQNMVRIGKEIAEQLEKAGIGVIHDTTIYDAKYSGAYERSGEAVDEYLKKYPSIQVVLDVHRDAIQTSQTSKIKPVTTIGGKKAAQIMTITGCEGGDITDFPNWQDNLTFAMHLQKTAEEMYPTLMRPLFFCNRKYNMYKSKNSVLLEMGSDANTLDEAAYSGRLIGNVLATMLKKYL